MEKEPEQKESSKEEVTFEDPLGILKTERKQPQTISVEVEKKKRATRGSQI